MMSELPSLLPIIIMTAFVNTEMVFGQMTVPLELTPSQLQYVRGDHTIQTYQFKYFYPATFQVEIPVQVSTCNDGNWCNITHIFPVISNILNPNRFTSCETGDSTGCHDSESIVFDDTSKQISFTKMMERKATSSNIVSVASKALKTALHVLSDVVPATILPSPFNALLKTGLAGTFKLLKSEIAHTWLAPNDEDQEKFIAGHKLTLQVFSIFIENLKFLNAMQVCENGFIPTSIISRRYIDDKSKSILNSFDFKNSLNAIPNLDVLLKLQIADCITASKDLIVVINIPVYEAVQVEKYFGGFSDFINEHQVYIFFGFQIINVVLITFVFIRYGRLTKILSVGVVLAPGVGAAAIGKQVESGWFETVDEIQLLGVCVALAMIHYVLKAFLQKFELATKTQTDKLQNLYDVMTEVNNHVVDINFQVANFINTEPRSK